MLHIISAHKSTTMITHEDGNALNKLGIDGFMNFILHKSKLCEILSYEEKIKLNYIEYFLEF